MIQRIAGSSEGLLQPRFSAGSISSICGVLLATSRIAGSILRAPGAQAHATVTHRGTYAFHVVLKRATLVKGATYVVHLAAINARGKTAALAIHFHG